MHCQILYLMMQNIKKYIVVKYCIDSVTLKLWLNYNCYTRVVRFLSKPSTLFTFIIFHISNVRLEHGSR